MYALWAASLCLSIAVDTVVWADSIKNYAPVWCDIGVYWLHCCLLCILTNLKVSHLQIGGNAGVATCSLVITRRLYMITRFRAIPSNRKEVKLDFPPSMDKPHNLTGWIRNASKYPLILFCALAYLFYKWFYVCHAILMGVYLSLIVLFLDYIVQAARFQIWEEFGCLNALASTGLSFIISNGLPILMPAISGLFYCRELCFTAVLWFTLIYITP